tara:strand:- start:2731 stop:3093 length:363 start_codon:yes stop_codon:yes gene_type:complete
MTKKRPLAEDLGPDQLKDESDIWFDLRRPEPLEAAPSGSAFYDDPAIDHVTPILDKTDVPSWVAPQKTSLEERMGEAVEYDYLTGTFHKRQPAVLEERENPYWTKMGQPRRDVILKETDE